MPFVPISNTVEVKLYAQRSGRLRLNVFHYRYNNPPPSSAELASLCTEIEGGIVQEYEDFISLGTQWYQIVATDIATSGGATATRSINRLSAGPVDDFPGNVSYVLSKRTGTTGRSARGRFYLIYLPEDFFNGDNFNPFYAATVNDLVFQLLQPRVGGRFTPAVASRTQGISRPITAITSDGVADSQRRRLTGRGA